MLTRRLGGSLCWLSLLHLISNFSGPLTHQGPKGPLCWAFSTTSCLLTRLVSNSWLLVLTELYNSSTPTQSLEWHVWSSSSRNKCHAVHRSLSSGSSLWSGTFNLSHIISRAHLRDFFRLLAIGMCHFHYLWNGIFAQVKGQNTTLCLTI